MEKDVWIRVIGIQGEDTLENRVVTRVEGLYRKKENKIYLTYQDTSLETDQLIPTTIKIEAEQVTVTRRGEVATKIIYRKNYKHLVTYATTVGNILLEINTEQIKMVTLENQLEVEILYTMIIGESEGILSKLIIQVSS